MDERYAELPHEPKEPEILEAELHAVRTLLKVILQLMYQNKGTVGELRGRLKKLLENTHLQKPRLSEQGLSHYTQVLQDFHDDLSDPIVSAFKKRT